MSKTVVCEHIYRNAAGKEVAKKQILIDTQGKKSAVWYEMPGKRKGLSVDTKRQIPLYDLDIIAKAVNADPSAPVFEKPIFFAEGEKDVETLKKMGLLATSGRNGGNSFPRWEEISPFIGKAETVFILTDHDDTGERYAFSALRELSGKIGNVYIIDCIDIFDAIDGTVIKKVPKLPKHSDITDLSDTYGFQCAKDALTACIDNRYRFGNHEKYAVAAKDAASRYEPSFEEIIPMEQACAVEFPDEAFPPQLNAYVESVSAAMQCRKKIPATFMLGFLSTIFQKSYKVRVKEGYVDSLSLYTVVSADASAGKSRCLKKFTTPFYEFEKEYRESQKDLIAEGKNEKRRYERQQVELDARRDNIEKEFKAAEEGTVGLYVGNATEKLEKIKEEQIQNQVYLDECEIAAPLRLFVDETTPEAFLKNMREQHGRLAFLVDDARSFFSELNEGKYNKMSGMLAILLKAFNAQGHTVDRKGDKQSNIGIDEMNTAIIIAVQPDKLLDFFRKPDNFTSGIASRFLFTTLHDEERIALKYESPSIPDKLYRTYSEGVKKALKKSFAVENPIICRFSDKLETVEGTNKKLSAEKFMQLMADQLYNETLAVSDEKIAWQNRSVSMMARIAALLSLWENIVEKGFEHSENIISLENLTRAYKIISFFSDTFNSLCESGNKLYIDSLKILKYIKSKKIEQFNRGDIIANFPRYNKMNVEVLYSRLKFLQERVYIDIVREPVKGRKKTVDTFYVNPKIYE